MSKYVKNILLFIEKKTKIHSMNVILLKISLEKFFVFFNNYLILFIMRSSINLMKIKNTRYKKKEKYQEKSQCN